jgi:RND superfamily putative drug exporter
VLGWVLVLAAVIVCAALFSGRTSDKFEVPGTESQRAQDLLHERFPGAGGAQARVVYYAPPGEKLTDPENKAGVMASVDQLKKADDVETVIDPYQAHALTKDGRLGYADVIYPVPSDEIDSQARDELAAAADPARDAGLQVEFNGGLVDDSTTANSEGISLMVGYVVLAITLASLLAAGLPLINAILGVAIGVTGSRPCRGSSTPRRPRRSSRRCSDSRLGSTTRCSSSRGIGRTSPTE